MAYTGTDFSTPKLDGQALRRYTSKNIKENIFQEILALPEKGVTERFSEDTNASEIRIIRQSVPNINARRMGATVNGGYFNSNNPLMPQSVEYGLKVLYMVDDAVDFPTVMDEMVELPVAEATTKSVAGLVATNINASTLAHQIAAVVNAEVAVAGSSNNVVLSAAGAYKDALLDASGKLDDGDYENGVQMFDINGRQGFLRSAARTGLLKTGQIIIGGSNYAQEMLARGVVTPDTSKQDKLSYFGEVDTIPLCVVSKPIWDLAEKYLQIFAGKLSTVHGVIVAGIATGRALAFNNSVKMIDSPSGQGKRAQYKYRWGVEVFHAKGIVPILAYGSTLATVSATELTLEAPSSQGAWEALTAPTLTNVAQSTKFTWVAITGAGSYKVFKGTEVVDTVLSSETLEYVYGTKDGSYTVVAVSNTYYKTDSVASTAVVVTGS